MRWTPGRGVARILEGGAQRGGVRFAPIYYCQKFEPEATPLNIMTSNLTYLPSWVWPDLVFANIEAIRKLFSYEQTVLTDYRFKIESFLLAN